MVYAFVKIHKIYMFTLNYNYCRVKSFCQKQGSKEKEPSDFVFNQKVLNFLFLFLLLLLW